MRCRARPFGSTFPFLQDLSSSVQSKIERLSREYESLARELIDTQSKLTAYEQARERLQQEVSLAGETYGTLARKAQEASLANGEDAPAKIAAQATRPDKPSSPRIRLNYFMGAALGSMLSVIYIFASDWFRGSPNEEQL